jgi:hypothetical protein
LVYEIEMLYHLPALILRSHGLYPQHVRNALIEAFTIHVRQLIAFFWPLGRRRRGGLLAADYFPPGRWDEVRPERPAVLDEALRRKVGWGIAHLTHDRAWSKPEDKLWDFVGLGRALAPAVICFVDHVDHTKLDPAYPPVAMKAYAEAFLASTDPGPRDRAPTLQRPGA